MLLPNVLLFYLIHVVTKNKILMIDYGYGCLLTAYI